MLPNVITPDLLELMDTGSPGDIDFYSQYARHRGGPVLVLLSGTGRVAVPIARQGVPVIGIDADAAMVDQAKRKAQLGNVARAMFVRADPTNFVSDSKHPLVIIPGGALSRLLSLDDQRQALLSVRTALAFGGKLVFDLPILDPGEAVPAQPAVRHVGPSAQVTAVLHRYRTFDSTRQLTQDTVSCEWLDASGQVTGKQYAAVTLRYSTPAEIQLLLEACGFAPVLYGGFDRHPLLPGAARLVIEADRKD